MYKLRSQNILSLIKDLLSMTLAYIVYLVLEEEADLIAGTSIKKKEKHHPLKKKKV